MRSINKFFTSSGLWFSILLLGLSTFGLGYSVRGLTHNCPPPETSASQKKDYPSMPTKPLLKEALAVEIKTAHGIMVTFHSDAAKRWVLEKGAEFGTFSDFGEDHPRDRFLRVYNGYDTNEVAAYLRSYNILPFQMKREVLNGQ